MKIDETDKKIRSRKFIDNIKLKNYNFGKVLGNNY